MASEAELLALAERCEKATSVDQQAIRELDVLICGAVGHGQIRDRHLYHWSPAGSTTESMRAPSYTTSFDAAMTLVPEGNWEPYGSAVSPWNVVITTAYNSVSVCPIDGDSTGMRDKRGGRSRARSVPLALCAAALRARAATMGGSDD